MKLTKKSEKSSVIHWPTFAISGFACIVSAISLICNIAQNNRIYEHSYKIDALAHKPRLEPSNGIFFDTINVYIDALPDDIFKPTLPTSFPLDSIPKDSVTMKPEIMGRVRIFNKGDDVASVILFSSLDRTSTDEIARDFLIGKKTPPLKTIFDTTGFEFIIDISPQDSYDFEFSKKLQFISEEGEAILHFFLMYENQFGALFDTYYWVRLRFSGGNVLAVKNSKGQIHFFFLPNDLQNMVKIEKSRASYKTYGVNEKRKAMATLNKIKNYKP